MKYRTKFVNKKDRFNTINICAPQVNKSFEDYHNTFLKGKKISYTNSNIGMKQFNKFKKPTRNAQFKFIFDKTSKNRFQKKRTRFYNYSNSYLRSDSNLSICYIDFNWASNAFFDPPRKVILKKHRSKIIVDDDDYLNSNIGKFNETSENAKSRMAMTIDYYDNFSIPNQIFQNNFRKKKRSQKKIEKIPFDFIRRLKKYVKVSSKKQNQM